MPTYQYVCEKCGHEFDIFQSISAKPLEFCPEDACGKKRWGKGKVKRAIGAGAGLIFKGSGFYITDYRSENYKQAAKKDSGSGSSSSSSTGTSTSGGSSSSSSSGSGSASTSTASTSGKPKPTKA